MNYQILESFGQGPQNGIGEKGDEKGNHMNGLKDEACSGHLTDCDHSFFLNGFIPEQDGLAASALHDFRNRSGLSADILQRAQIRIFSGNSDRLKECLGFSNLNGHNILTVSRLVEIPSFDPDGKISEYHFRLYPVIEGRRYLHPKAKPARPYILPWVWDIREKTSKPLWITEGAKKVLKLVQHGGAAIGLQGVWNFREAGEGDEAFLFDDLAAFSLKGRTVYIGFDQDLWSNPQVRFALFELALKLQSRGALIRFPRWTEEKGIDDYLAKRNLPEEALQTIEGSAVPFEKFISLDDKDALLRALKKTYSAFDAVGRESLVRTIAKKLNVGANRLLAELKHDKRSTVASVGEEPNQPESQRPVLPYGFRNRPDGLYFDEENKDVEIIPVKICSPLEVLALTRDGESRDWGRLLHFKDPDGKSKRWAMPTSLLSGDGTQLRSELLSMGLILEPGRKARERLERYLMQSLSSARVRCVSKVGWFDKCYVLPNTSYGSTDGEEVVYQGSPTAEQQFQVSGSAEDWRENVGKVCAGNSRLVLAVSAAFAGPLLHPLLAESGGLHFRGGSSIGKTTALSVAASVWGRPEGYVNQWRATANGLETIALARNDGLLCLDELSQLPPREASETAYLLANGQSKARMGKNILARKASHWRLLFLSTGELALADKIAEAGTGRRATAGQEVRVIDIPADAGVGIGLFEDMHGAADGAEFARHLKIKAGEYYGAVGRAFLEEITRNIDTLPEQIKEACKIWMRKYHPPGASGQVERVAGRFALIAAAGELASKMGLTGWAEGEATRAAGKNFWDWLESRGTAGALEPEAALAQVRGFLGLHGESRFTPWEDEDPSRPTINRAGFRRKTEEGMEYYIFAEAWKEICHGHDPRATARILAERGYLIGSDGRMKYRCRLPGLALAWVYRISSKIFAEID